MADASTENNATQAGAIEYLKILQSVNNSLGLKIAVDYMQKYSNPFDLLTKEVSPVFKIIGKLYSASGSKVPLSDYATIISGAFTMVDSMIDLFEGVKSKTKTSVDISAFVVSFTSTCASIQGAIFKLVDVKSPIVLPLVSAALGLTANVISTMDGVTEEDIKKIDKSVLGLATSLGTTYAKAYFPGNKALSSSLGPIALATSAISGFMTGWDEFKSTLKEYEDNGIPSDIAIKDAIINGLANVVHGTATSFTGGADDVVFGLAQSIASWITKSEVSHKDKNYVEWIVEGLKTLNVTNTGTSSDDTLINDTNASYIYGEAGNDRISNFASRATIWGAVMGMTLCLAMLIGKAHSFSITPC